MFYHFIIGSSLFIYCIVITVLIFNFHHTVPLVLNHRTNNNNNHNKIKNTKNKINKKNIKIYKIKQKYNQVPQFSLFTIHTFYISLFSHSADPSHYTS